MDQTILYQCHARGYPIPLWVCRCQMEMHDACRIMLAFKMGLNQSQGPSPHGVFAIRWFERRELQRMKANSIDLEQNMAVRKAMGSLPDIDRES